MMRPLRIPHLIPCFVMILFFLIFPFSDISIADKATNELKHEDANMCISCCNDRRMPCRNFFPDRRVCEAVFQTCLKTCNSRGAVPSEWSDCWDGIVPPRQGGETLSERRLKSTFSALTPDSAERMISSFLSGKIIAKYFT